MATARVMAEAPQPALEATKRYLVSNAGVTFDEAFAIEHDRVFDQFLLGDLGGLTPGVSPPSPAWRAAASC